MTTDSAIVPMGGLGGAPLKPWSHSGPDRHFLSLQETCLASGLVEAVAGGIPRLRAIAEDTTQTRRTRMRAEALLQALARHVLPAPKGSDLEVEMTGPGTIKFRSMLPEEPQ